MYKVQQAKSEQEVAAILQLRYKILREPWGQPAGTATDNLEMSSVNAYITDEHGAVIACGRLQPTENNTGQIRFMAVDIDFQGKTLGKKIVTFLENAAMELEFTKIELHARENALAFYKSCGYTVKEKSYLLWGLIQHYLMEKSI